MRQDTRKKDENAGVAAAPAVPARRERLPARGDAQAIFTPLALIRTNYEVPGKFDDDSEDARKCTQLVASAAGSINGPSIQLGPLLAHENVHYEKALRCHR